MIGREVAAFSRLGVPTELAREDVQIVATVRETGIMTEVERALGPRYAGSWLTPAAVKFHIGVTTRRDRGRVESLIANDGLVSEVYATTVRSTRAQLLAAQRRWKRRLAPLLARSEAGTAIVPQHNAVSVRLSSSVPHAQRAALERVAAGEDVDVVVTVERSRQLRILPESRVTKCNVFKPDEANCDKPITPGVKIVSARGETCTAGPLAIIATKPLETYLLTAGHCLNNTFGESWYAYNLENERKEIGKSTRMIVRNKTGDYGAILVERGFWTESDPSNPVFALVARWKMPGPILTYPITGEKSPSIETANCHSGQTTGETCGIIVAESVENKIDGVLIEGMVEDYGATGESGDSGGPWFSVGPSNEAIVEGTHIGSLEGNKKVTYYEPIKTILDSWKMLLLTTANEIRPDESGISSLALAQWLSNTGFFEGGLPVETEGVLRLEDSSLGAAVRCGMLIKGTANGSDGEGLVSEFLNLNREKIGAPLAGLGLICSTEAVCEGSSSIEVWPTNLPWETLVQLVVLVDGHEGYYDLLLSGSGGLPGFEVLCTVLGLVVSDTCEDVEGSGGEVLNAATGVEAKLEEPALPLANCSFGGTATGSLRWLSNITKLSGATLGVSE